VLGITDSRISDNGLVYLSGLSNLKKLFLDGTHVTDSGLQHLKGLLMLKWLYLRGTSVSDVGIAVLRETLPDLEVIR
jgi:internalin A